MRGLPFAVLTLLGLYACGLDAPNEPSYGAPGAIRDRDEVLSKIGGGTTPTADGGAAAGACESEADWAKDDDPTCTVKFSTTIFPKMKDDGVWKCSVQGCHNAITVKPLIPMTDAKAAFDALRKHKPGAPALFYVNPCSKSLADSFIVNNFKYEAADNNKGKLKMPPAGATPADIAELEKWVTCGSPF